MINVDSGIFDRGTGPTFLKDVHCRSDETNFNECLNNKDVNNNCYHSDDTGVICLKGIAMYFVR